MLTQKNEIGSELSVQAGFSCLDRRFAAFMNRLADQKSEELLLGSALVSCFTGQGHTCVDLAGHAGGMTARMGRGSEAEISWPEIDVWLDCLTKSGVVAGPGDLAPLVLSGTRLYLYRYWQDEHQLIEFIKDRGRRLMSGIDRQLLQDGLARIFPATDQAGEVDWQRIAALAAVAGQVAVITGGPGTGKTFTVAGILALLLEQAEKAGKKINIVLCAPTGKAAARLQSAISEGLQRLNCADGILNAMPAHAVTVHRLLGAGRQGRSFIYNEANHLTADAVVVDEASMVDLPLMASLMRALPADCRLILLGDRDQLAAVEPGSVLGDFCAPELVSAFSEDFVALARSVAAQNLDAGATNAAAGFCDSVIELKMSRRFSEASGIAAISRAVKSGDQEALLAVFDHESEGRDVVWRDLPSPKTFAAQLTEKIQPWLKKLCLCNSAAEALALLGEQGILCALRQGPWGVDTVNQLIEASLARHGLRPAGHEHYPGRPLLIRENNYHLDLFNGDIGVVQSVEQGNNGLRVFFPKADNGVRSFSLFRLPAYEPAFALTVHKSQGSEFKRVLLILPDMPSPVLCRELIYTGLTRARESVEVWGSRQVFRQALVAQSNRQSGLRDGLVALKITRLTGKWSEV